MYALAGAPFGLGLALVLDLLLGAVFHCLYILFDSVQHTTYGATVWLFVHGEQ